MIIRESCDLCGSKPENWMHIFEKNGYNVLLCKKCKFIFTEAVPEEEELLLSYSEPYFNGEIYTNYTQRLFERRKGNISLLTFFQDNTSLKSGNILEIGCATGDFLDAARFLGYNAEGVEISKWASEVGKNKGHIIYNTDIMKSKVNMLKENYYDAIFMLDVFEHFAYPNKVLKKLKNYLKQDGFIVLNTLNIASPTVKYLGKKWSHYYPPYHLSYFSEETMKSILIKNDFTILYFGTNGALFYDDSYKKYYLFKRFFENKMVNKITNKLNMGYVQFVIAQKK